MKYFSVVIKSIEHPLNILNIIFYFLHALTHHRSRFLSEDPTCFLKDTAVFRSGRLHAYAIIQSLSDRLPSQPGVPGLCTLVTHPAWSALVVSLHVPSTVLVRGCKRQRTPLNPSRMTLSQPPLPLNHCPHHQQCQESLWDKKSWMSSSITIMASAFLASTPKSLAGWSGGYCMGSCSPGGRGGGYVRDQILESELRCFDFVLAR